MKTFGEIITGKMHAKGWTLRSFWKELEAKGSIVSSSKLSKIMRGIQNPKDKTEFNELMTALDITDPTELQVLETMAMNFIPPKPLSDEEFMASLPIPIGRTFKDEAELNEFIKSWRKLMEADAEPDLK